MIDADTGIPMPIDPAATCARKKRYLSDADAKRAARPQGLHYYRCPVCHRFHLTQMPQAPAAGQEERG